MSSVERFTVARRSSLQQQEGKSGIERDLHLQEKEEVCVQICKMVLCSFVCSRPVFILHLSELTAQSVKQRLFLAVTFYMYLTSANTIVCITH